MKFTLGFLWMLWHSLWILSGFAWYGVRSACKKLKQKILKYKRGLEEKMKLLDEFLDHWSHMIVLTICVTIVGLTVGAVAGMVAVAKYLTLLVIVYTALRLITLYFAPKEIFFSGVKPGRIKRINNNGKLVKFIAHLKGLTGILDDPSQPDGLHIGACHIDEATGQILPGEEVINSIWWTLFGVRPLGFNSISDYKLKKKKIVEVEVEEAGVDGKKKKVKKNVVVEEEFTASSLFFSESYPDFMPDLETKDGIRVDVIFNINLQTTHAGESYKFDSWPANVWPSTRALTKDYVSSRTEEQLRAEQNELSTNPDGYIGRLRGLNDNSKGNISLSLRTGQRVNGGNLVDLAFENLVAEALEKKRIAEAEGDAEIAKQRKKKEAALEEAEVIKTLGGARNEVLQEKAAILAAPGGDNLAKTEVARELGEGMREHKGALGIGGTSSIMFDGREGGK